MKQKNNKVLRFFKLIYLKLFRINDTPQKIAVGFGVGVFLGILPGTGPLAAIFAAFLFRLNRLTALLGSILSNTWLSIVTFILSIQIGASVMGIDWQEAHRNLLQFSKGLKFATLFKSATLKIFLPIIIGYLVIGFCAGLIAYAIALAIVKIRKAKTSPSKSSCHTAMPK